MDRLERVELVGDVFGASEVGHEIVAAAAVRWNLVEVQVQGHGTEGGGCVDAVIGPLCQLEEPPRWPALRKRMQLLVGDGTTAAKLRQELAQDGRLAFDPQFLRPNLGHGAGRRQNSAPVHVDQKSNSIRVHIRPPGDRPCAAAPWLWLPGNDAVEDFSFRCRLAAYQFARRGSNAPRELEAGLRSPRLSGVSEHDPVIGHFAAIQDSVDADATGIGETEALKQRNKAVVGIEVVLLPAMDVVRSASAVTIQQPCRHRSHWLAWLPCVCAGLT